MNAIFHMYFERVLEASRTEKNLRDAALARSEELSSAGAPGIVLLLKLASDSMKHVNVDQHDPKGEEKPLFQTSMLIDEVLFRFCQSWATPAVIENLKTVTGLEDELGVKLTEVTPLAAAAGRGRRASPFPVLAQAERLKSELVDFRSFENSLKNGTSKTRQLFFPYVDSIKTFGTIFGEITRKLEEVKASIAGLSNTILLEMMLTNITKNALLRELDSPVYGTSSLYFYLPAIAQRIVAPPATDMSLEYCQMLEHNIGKTLGRLNLLNTSLQMPGADDPQP
jgi:hypothetical protein